MIRNGQRLSLIFFAAAVIAVGGLLRVVYRWITKARAPIDVIIASPVNPVEVRSDCTNALLAICDGDIEFDDFYDDSYDPYGNGTYDNGDDHWIL